MSPEPRTQAIGIIQDALKSARQEGEQGDWIDDGTEAAELVDAMLAAGWVPPEAIEEWVCPKCDGKGTRLPLYPAWQLIKCGFCGGSGSRRIVRNGG